MRLSYSTDRCNGDVLVVVDGLNDKTINSCEVLKKDVAVRRLDAGPISNNTQVFVLSGVDRTDVYSFVTVPYPG